MHQCVLEKLWFHQAVFGLDTWLSLWPRPSGRFGSVQFHICAVTHWRIIKQDLFPCGDFSFTLNHFNTHQLKMRSWDWSGKRQSDKPSADLLLVFTHCMCDALCLWSDELTFRLPVTNLLNLNRSFEKSSKCKSQIWWILLTGGFNRIIFLDRRTHLKYERVEYKHFQPFTLLHSPLWWQIFVFKRASQLFLAHLVNFFVSAHQYSGGAQRGLLLRCLGAKCWKFRVLFPFSWLK